MAAASATGATRTIRLRNTTGKQQELWLEPLGDRVTLAPHVLYEVTATDALEEIDLSGDGFVVYGWVVQVESVADDGGRTTVWKI